MDNLLIGYTEKLETKYNVVFITVCNEIKFHHFIEDFSMYSHCKIRVSDRSAPNPIFQVL